LQKFVLSLVTRDADAMSDRLDLRARPLRGAAGAATIRQP
jgi:hypothetical protein